MNKEQAKKRIEELNKLTSYYAKKYYDDDDPEISDFEYDMLMVELRNLEAQFPEYISKESLTQKVGGTVKEGFSKVEHIVPLQSLQDVFSFEELDSFDTRIRKVAKEIMSKGVGKYKNSILGYEDLIKNYVDEKISGKCIKVLENYYNNYKIIKWG